MTKEIEDRTQKLSELLGEVAYSEDVELISLDAWTTGHIVQIIETLDAELQRRYEEHTERAPYEGVTVH